MDVNTFLNVEELLLKYGLATTEEIDSVRMERLNTGKSSKDIVFERGLVSHDAFYYALSTELGIPFVTIDAVSIDASLSALFSHETMSERLFIPLVQIDDEVRFAVADPLDKELLQLLEDTFPGKSVQLSVALPSNIGDTLEALRRKDGLEPQKAGAVESQKTASASIAVFYSALSEAVASGASFVYFESLKEGLRIRRRVDRELILSGMYPAACMEHIAIKLMELVNNPEGTSGSVKTVIAGKDVFVYASILKAENDLGAYLRLTYPVRVRPLSGLPVTAQSADAIAKALWSGKGIVVVTGKDRQMRESVAESMLGELVSDKRKVVAFLAEHYTVEGVECYTCTGATNLNALLDAATGMGADALYLQQLRRDGVNFRKVVELAEEVTIVATMSVPSGLDAISLIERNTHELTKEQRRVALVVETFDDTLPCPECTIVPNALGRGCSKCSHTGIAGTKERIDILYY